MPTTVSALPCTRRHAADQLDSFRQAVAEIPGTVEVYRLTGHYACVLEIVLPNAEHHDRVYRDLVWRVEVFDLAASISLETPKADTALPTGFA